MGGGHGSCLYDVNSVIAAGACVCALKIFLVAGASLVPPFFDVATISGDAYVAVVTPLLLRP